MWLVSMPANQVQQWKQKDPDDVAEGPVEAADLNWAVILGGNRAVPRPHEHVRHDPETDDHVQRVQAGHQEIQRKEDLRVPEVLALELKRRPGHVVLDE